MAGQGVDQHLTKSGGLSDALRAVALELRTRASEIEAGATLLLTVSEAVGRVEDSTVVSRQIAAGILGLTQRETPHVPDRPLPRIPQTLPGESTYARALQERLWDETPFVVLYAATVKSSGRVGLACVGIDRDGRKHVLGWKEGATSSQQGPSQAFVEELFTHGVGIAATQPLLWVTDGGYALDSLIPKRYPDAKVALCQSALRVRVLSHLSHAPIEGEVRAELRRALHPASVDEIRRHLERLAQSLSLSHPGAALSVREGMKGALVLPSLEPTPALFRSLATCAGLHTAFAEATRLGRMKASEGQDPLTLGVEEWERRTRRVVGYEGMEALSLALRTQSRAA